MPAHPLIAAFRRELPLTLRCADWTAEKSAYHVVAFARRQSAPLPDCLTREAVIEHVSWLASTPPRHRDGERRAASTVNEHLKGLKRFTRWAVGRGLMPSNPIADLKGLRNVRTVRLAPEPEVVRAILDAAKEHGPTAELQARNHALLAMLADIGMRASEALGIDVADLDFEREQLTLRKAKGSKERVVALNPDVIAALNEYLPLRRAAPDERALFVTVRGNRMRYPALRNMLLDIRKRLNINVTLHDHRRFVLSGMYGKGMGELALQGISGHENLADLRPYIVAAMAKRAVREHREYSMLAGL